MGYFFLAPDKVCNCPASGDAGNLPRKRSA
jgi:hypothetical protein